MIGIALIEAIVLILIWNKSKQSLIEKNMAIVWNFNTDQSDGHATLLEFKKLQSSRDKETYSCYPVDVYYSDNSENDESEKRLKPLQSIHLDWDYRESLPKGTLSSHRDHIIYYPMHPERLPPTLKNSKFGQALEYVSILVQTENIIIKGMTKGYKTVSEIYQMHEFGEMKAIHLKRLEENIRKAIEIKLSTIGDQQQQTKA